MDDLSFRWPQKVLKWLVIGFFSVSILYGLVTWNFDNFLNFWTWAITFITEPIFNFYTERMERLVTIVLEVAFNVGD
ncbi:MAG: hypothetical protein H6779_02485 [Candidatus Nomurabacteria bacterium]|nr:hypothetical protein [Candidatus Nomurabacteria bacterium]USN88288.1 MAG: hypothetical protein H6779_02485 [Candidatus Nomurabacteria bacterium]